MIGLSVLVVLVAIVTVAVQWALLDTGPPGPAPYSYQYDPLVTTPATTTTGAAP